jgi:replicative DNA helicase
MYENDLDSQLSFSAEAEQSVLGAILLNSQVLSNVMDILKPDYFFVGVNKALYSVFVSMFAVATPIDIVTVLHEVTKAGIFDSEKEAKVYLTELANFVPTTANVESYVTILSEKYYARSLVLAAREIIERSNAVDSNTEGLLDWSEQQICEIRRDKISSDKSEIMAFDEYVDACRNYNPSEGFCASLFNNVIFPPGTLSLIGARTSRGKTTALVNLAREVITAATTNRKVLFLTLEMDPKAIITKLILSITFALGRKADYMLAREHPTKDHYLLFRDGVSIPTEDDKEGTQRFIDYRNEAVNIVRLALENNQLIIFDGRGGSHNKIINAVNIHADLNALVLLDYIQKVPAVDGGATDNYRRITDISHSIVNTAVRTNTIIIAGAQFSRMCGKNGNGDDIFSDESFRESGDLEQDAENAIGIGWDKEKTVRFFEVLKCRQGGVNQQRYSLEFDGAFSYMAIGNKNDMKWGFFN